MNLQNEFWLGNENIFTLTLQGLYPRGNGLRIEIMNAKMIKKSIKYRNFHIENAASTLQWCFKGCTERA